MGVRTTATTTTSITAVTASKLKFCFETTGGIVEVVEVQAYQGTTKRTLTVSSATGWTNAGAARDGVTSTASSSARATIGRQDGVFRCMELAISGGPVSVNRIVLTHDANGTSRVERFYVQSK